MAISLILSCKSKEPSRTSPQATVLIQLHDENTIAELEEDFMRFALKREKIVSRPMNIHLFKFDANKVADTTLVDFLRQSSLVKEAQTNKEITTRKN